MCLSVLFLFSDKIQHFSVLLPDIKHSNIMRVYMGVSQSVIGTKLMLIVMEVLFLHCFYNFVFDYCIKCCFSFPQIGSWTP